MNEKIKAGARVQFVSEGHAFHERSGKVIELHPGAHATVRLDAVGDEPELDINAPHRWLALEDDDEPAPSSKPPKRTKPKPSPAT